MAAAPLVIPIIAALEPIVLPWIIRLIDKVFPPKTGPIKLPVASSWVQILIDGLIKATAGAAGQLPDMATITTAVQAAVDAANKAGDLKGAATNIPVPGTTTDAPTVSDARLMLQVLAGVAPTLGVKL